MGYWASKFLEKDGGKITCIIEYNCAVYKADGFDIEHVKKYMEENNNSLQGYD